MNAAFKKYRVEWLLLSDLMAHPKVQRKFRPARAEDLAKRFDPDLFRELYVIQSGAKYLVFDGQHRLAAALKVLGADQKVPCRVFEETPTERQAELFLGLNDAVRVGNLDRWRQRLTAREATACQIEGLLHKHDLKSPPSGHYRTPNVVPCVASLERIWTQPNGPQILDRSLGVVLRAWPKESSAFNGVVLEGVATVVAKFNGQIKDSDLSERLSSRTTPSRLIGSAREWSSASSTTVRKAAAEVILRLFNKRMFKKVQ